VPCLHDRSFLPLQLVQQKEKLMEREQDNSGLVELGTASIDTLGVPTGDRSEGIGYFALGISDE